MISDTVSEGTATLAISFSNFLLGHAVPAALCVHVASSAGPACSMSTYGPHSGCLDGSACQPAVLSALTAVCSELPNAATKLLVSPCQRFERALLCLLLQVVYNYLGSVLSVIKNVTNLDGGLRPTEIRLPGKSSCPSAES